jgi:hypothetical protein
MAASRRFGFLGWAFGAGSEKICYACLEPLGEGRILDEDGRAFCGSCASKRLADRDTLLELWKRVRGYTRVRLRLRVPPATLHELSPVALGRQLGVEWTGGVERALAQTQVNPMRSAILIESGLPIDLASEVLAHEVGHLWFAHYGDSGAGENMIEGFPQWVAYGFCRESGLRAQMDRILHRPSTMGRGVRQLVNLERQKGRDAVIGVAKARPGRTPR